MFHWKGWSQGFVIIEAMSHAEKVFIPDEKDYHEDGEKHGFYYHELQ